MFFVILVTENSGAALGKDTTFKNLRPESKALGSLLLKSPNEVKGEYSQKFSTENSWQN